MYREKQIEKRVEKLFEKQKSREEKKVDEEVELVISTFESLPPQNSVRGEGNITNKALNILQRLDIHVSNYKHPKCDHGPLIYEDRCGDCETPLF